MRKWTKIKHNPSTLETVLAWHVDREDGAGAPDKYTLEVTEAPPPEFADAFKALREHVAVIVEAPWTESLTVTQVSLSYKGEDQVMMAIFTAQRSLEDTTAPLCFNTPVKPAAELHEGQDENLLTAECVQAIDALIEAAEAVLEGERAQGVLFRPAKQTKAGGRFTTKPKAVRAA